jgi:hypothetical protein
MPAAVATEGAGDTAATRPRCASRYKDLWAEAYVAYLNLLNQAKTTKEAEQ